MTRKALPPLLDPVLGQNVELGLCKERMDMGEMLLFGLDLLFFAYTFLLSLSIARGSLCDKKQAQGVGLTL
jgi:hypothetical protein